MWIGVISLFPEMFKAITEFGVTGKAVKHNLLQVECWNPRDFTFDKHKTVDDRPYGGGPGMLMMVQPLRDAIHAARAAAGEGAKVIYLSPQGRKLDQGGITELAQNQKLILVCGRYEGIDERLIQTEIDEEWSIGDYVLTGGELPAMVMIDSISRLVPGVLHNDDSAGDESFENGLLEYPQYTRPVEFMGKKVPDVLLSGHHANVDKWRREQSVIRTFNKRPELLENAQLSKSEIELINKLKNNG